MSVNPHSGSQTFQTKKTSVEFPRRWMHELWVVFVCVLSSERISYFGKKGDKRSYWDNKEERGRYEAEVTLYCGISSMSAAALWGHWLISELLSTGHNSPTTSKSSLANAEGNSGASMNRARECAASAYWNCLNFNKQRCSFESLSTCRPSDPSESVLMH